MSPYIHQRQHRYQQARALAERPYFDRYPFEQMRLQHIRKLLQSFAWSTPASEGLFLVFVCLETTEYKVQCPLSNISY